MAQFQASVPGDVEKLRDQQEAELFDESGATIQKITPELEQQLQQSDAAVNQVISSATELAAGKLPTDVSDAVRQTASESASGRGLGFGTAGRALSLRDLGIASTTAIESGARIIEPFARLTQQKKEFELKLDLDRRRFLEDVRKGDQNEFALDLKRRELEDRTALDALGLMADTLDAYHRTGFSYAASPDAPQENASALSNDFNALLDSIRGFNA